MHALVACEHCDWLHQERPLRAHEKALCVRCGGVLYRAWPDSLRRTHALSLAALALLVVANVYPFLSFTLEGQTSVNRIVSGVFLLWQVGYAPLALLILFSAWNLVREATDVLLESAPSHLDMSAVLEALRSVEGLDEVHDVHVWTLNEEDKIRRMIDRFPDNVISDYPARVRAILDARTPEDVTAAAVRRLFAR